MTRVVLAEKRVRIGANRQRRAEIRPVLAAARGVVLSNDPAAAWQVAAMEVTGGILRLADSRLDVQVCNECTLASPTLRLSTRSIGRAGSVSRRSLFLLRGRAEQGIIDLQRKPRRNRSAGRKCCFGCAQLYAVWHGTRGGGGCDGLVHYQPLPKLHDSPVGASQQAGYRQLGV